MKSIWIYYKSNKDSPIIKSIVFALLMIVGFVFFALATGIGILTNSDEFSAKSMLVLQIALFEAVPVIIYLFIYKKDINIVSALSLRKISWVNLLFIFALQIFISPLINIANYISFLFGNNEAVEYIANMGMSFGEMFILIAIIGPITEEVIFRGVIFDITKGKSVKFMALVSGITFALFHMDINQFSYAIILGALFTVYVAYTGSILSSIFAHFMVNGYSTVLFKLTEKVEGSFESALGSSSENFTFETNTFFIFLLISIVSTMIFLLIFKYFKKYNKEKNIYYKINCKKESDENNIEITEV